MTTEAGDPMGTTTTTYADAVRRALDDLPAARYLELVDGLDEHLAEVRAEADGTLADVLGPPEAYAAELRASAGLPPRVGAGAPLPPPIAPPVTAPAVARLAIERGTLARFGLALTGGLIVLWALGVQELPTLKLALIVLGVLGATWIARRLLGAAAWPDRTSRRVKVAIAVGGLVAAAAFGSAASNRRSYVPVYDVPGVTFATVPYPPAERIALPDFRGWSMDQATEAATNLGLVVNIQGGAGNAIVMGQDPAPQTFVTPGATLILSTTPLPATTPPTDTSTPVAVTQATAPTVASTPVTSVAPTSAPASAASTTATVATGPAPSTAGPTTTLTPTTAPG